MVDVAWIGSPNFYPQNGIEKRFITLHWMVGTLRTTDTTFSSSSRKASATYGVGPSAIHQYVQEKDYPFSDGNTYANQHTISIEHEGGWLDGNGNRVAPSAAVLENSAQLCADIARRRGWSSLQWMVNVFPHNHWVATMCPGTTDYGTIVHRANQILGASVLAMAGVNGGTSVAQGWNASSWSTSQIQTALIKLGYNLGATGADGDYGQLTTAAVRKFEQDQGLSVDVGTAGPQVVGRLAQLTGDATPLAQSNKLVVDGKMGLLTTKAEQRALDVDPDGVRGPNTIRAEQKRTGAFPDGIDGPNTRERLQLTLKALGYYGGKIDKIIGPQSIRALQSALNDGRF
ncbi:N-acetylmuramoyl-L-alanine amidase [Frigoribacterium sp. CG_9.8]|uniref:peptidoglycan recognition protein family protein n=1 Tax=Frigoribacterium sp. CG_9.8 TaxID=2787733 RepID=UPI0018C92F08|nr:N-acetylmuramoyl-L-alanine amidase [Frigoribacterium sp. CG_9.8]MBG6106629.1 peptidoglycan hydrolase-like protein with peptidoglycan-binding domain [Frigoribacterium sp. CG_9.8]